MFCIDTAASEPSVTTSESSATMDRGQREAPLAQHCKPEGKDQRVLRLPPHLVGQITLSLLCPIRCSHTGVIDNVLDQKLYLEVDDGSLHLSALEKTAAILQRRNVITVSFRKYYRTRRGTEGTPQEDTVRYAYMSNFTTAPAAITAP